MTKIASNYQKEARSQHIQRLTICTTYSQRLSIFCKFEVHGSVDRLNSHLDNCVCLACRSKYAFEPQTLRIKKRPRALRRRSWRSMLRPHQVFYIAGDESRAPLTGEIRPCPFKHHYDSVSETNEIKNVD